MTVWLPGVLRPDAGGATRITTELVAGATLGDLFAELAAAHPRLERRVRDERGEIRRYVNVFLDGVESRRCGGLAAPLRDGQEISIIQSVAGG
ncbi:MAG TPA: MoaD/ThiS family protein [Mycobacteriales bacterium]|nr:MoaD/ThiS family protein [Mycobacteriales bacterium]